MKRLRKTTPFVWCIATVLAACASSPQPAAPPPGAAEGDAHAHAGHDRATSSHAHAAVAEFMNHMIHHHAQALEMALLVPSRTGNEQLRMLAERVDVSQRDEIGQMQRWLRDRGLYAPDPIRHHQDQADGHADADHGHHHAGHAAMPGMLTRDEMGRLAAARGPAFDQLFLESMIRHHEGALVMVADLFGVPGATDDTEVFQLTSEIESDQRLEIARMQRLLASLSD